MRKNWIKSSVVWLLTVAIVFAGFTSFAEDKAKTEEPLTLSEKIEKYVNNLTILSGYPDVSKESLYKAAFESVFKDNPELYETVMKAMLSSIDENSVYYNAEEAKRFLQDLNDEVTGIGVNVFFSDGSIIVSEPIPGSPAEKAGVRAGDIIIGADDVDLRGMDFDPALEYVRGPVGTWVKVKIIRSGIPEPLSFTIKREKVVSNPVDYEIIENEDKKIGKIRIYSFTQNVAENFKAALNEISNKGIKNIIIDVRDNGGGYLDQAIDIADLFLEKGALITTEEHKMSILNKVYKASGNGKKYNTVILINGMSASASEVLTAALCENEVAKSVGEKSFGKGTVQSVSQLADGSIIKFTSAYYLTPLGNNIHKSGITPDVKVENSEKLVDMSNFEAFALSKTYKPGDKGKEVELAKRMLKELGIYIGEVNETYDDNLKIAVNTYQKIKGLFPYGVLDITTQMNLYDTLRTSKVEVDDQLQRAIDLF